MQAKQQGLSSRETDEQGIRAVEEKKITVKTSLNMQTFLLWLLCLPGILNLI